MTRMMILYTLEMRMKRDYSMMMVLVCRKRPIEHLSPHFFINQKLVEPHASIQRYSIYKKTRLLLLLLSLCICNIYIYIYCPIVLSALQIGYTWDLLLYPLVVFHIDHSICIISLTSESLILRTVLKTKRKNDACRNKIFVKNIITIN